MKITNFIIAVFFIFSFFLFICPIYAEDYVSIKAEAETKYQSGNFKESAELYEKAFKNGVADALDLYNAACSWARSDNVESAFQNLQKSIDKGWYDASWLENDPDLTNLHNDNRWKNLLTSVKLNLDKLTSELPSEHTALQTIDLPEPRYRSDVSVEESLHGRRSIRTYSDEPLTLLEISQLLWAAYGITKKQDSPEFLRGGFKTAPSAGGLYPLEIYIVVGKVTGIPAGVYKYIPKDHKLIKILDGDKRKALAEAGHSQSMINEAPVSFVYSAVFERTTKKYGDRGRERYVWLDAGHSAQNIYLQAYTLGIGVCVSGAFTDIMVKKAVNMIRQEEPVYIIPAGKIKKQG